MRGKGDFSLGNAGARLGSWLGGKAGDWLGSLFGSGDYSSVKANEPETNSLIVGGKVPRMNPSKGSNQFHVEHKEFLGYVASSNAFQSTEFPINPGLPVTFPWCAPIAGQFTNWTPRGIAAVYVPFVSPLGDNASGQVTLTAQYNVANPPFITQIQASNQEGAVTGRPMDPMIMGMECAEEARIPNAFNVRSGPVGSADPKLYDLCNFQVCVSGTDPDNDGQPIGQLWLTYDLVFQIPTIVETSTDGGMSVFTGHKASATDAHFWETLSGESSNPIAIEAVGSDTLVLKALDPGVYLAVLMMPNTSSSITLAASGAWAAMLNVSAPGAAEITVPFTVSPGTGGAVVESFGTSVLFGVTTAGDVAMSAGFSGVASVWNTTTCYLYVGNVAASPFSALAKVPPPFRKPAQQVAQQLIDVLRGLGLGSPAPLSRITYYEPAEEKKSAVAESDSDCEEVVAVTKADLARMIKAARNT